MRSIFSKYIISFVLVLGIGFVTIAAVLSSVLSEYSSESKKSLMENTAATIYEGICSVSERTGESFNEVCSKNTEFISKTAKPLAEYSESVVIITNSKGNILVNEGQDIKEIRKNNADVETILSLTDSESDFVYGNLGGLFSGMRFNYVYTVQEDSEQNPSGFIILSSAKQDFRI